jgi:hypothetical protein
MRDIISRMRDLSSLEIQDVPQGLAHLRRIRSAISENLNQIQA